MCLHYHYDRMEPSDELGSFFRFIGMYVMEKHYDRDVTLCEQISRFKDVFDVSVDTETEFDFHVYLVSRNADEEYIVENEDLKTAKSVLIATDGYMPGHFETCIQSNASSAIINSIINWIYEQSLISIDEKNELNALCTFYFKNGVYSLLARTKYLYPFVCDGADDLLQMYENIVDSLLVNIDNNINTWGDREYVVSQYSALYLAANANIYARRARKPYVYDSSDLLAKCSMFIPEDYDVTDMGGYDYAFVMLAGEISNCLLDEDKQAYDYYIMACNNEGEYNAYAFYLKGEYWRICGIRDDLALKYFLKSVIVYPRYYRAWYMLGCVLSDMGDFVNAIDAFTMVHVILKNRMKLSCMNARGYYCLFNAYVRYAGIQERRGKMKEAITGYLYAERLWNTVEDDKLLCKIDTDDYNIRRTLKQVLDVSEIYKCVAILYNNVGDKQQMDHYIKLLQK